MPEMRPEPALLRYPIRLIPEADGRVRLTFPDVPEAVVVADGEQEAIDGAPAELERALGGYAAAARPIPAPSDLCGAPLVGTRKFSFSGSG